MEAAYIEALNTGLISKRNDGRISDPFLLDEAERLSELVAREPIEEAAEPARRPSTTIPPPSWMTR